MPARVRQARSDDVESIARVHVQSWRTTYPGIVPQAYLDGLDERYFAERWQERLGREGFHLFVAEDEIGEVGQAICGFACGGRLREPLPAAESEAETAHEPDGEIYAIYLLRAAQGRGMGRMLMQQLAETLLAEGWRRAAVWVLEKNPACGFYERLGGRRMASKTIEIGGAELRELAYVWQELAELRGER